MHSASRWRYCARSYNRPVQSLDLDFGQAIVVPEPGDSAILRHLKQPALLFDRLLVAHLSGLVAFLSETGSDADLALAAELDWLSKQNVISAPNFENYLVDHFQAAVNQDYAFAGGDFEDYCKMTDLQLGVRFFKVLDADAFLLCSRVPLHMKLSRDYLAADEASEHSAADRLDPSGS